MKAVALKRDAYTLDAVIEAGIPPAVARTLVADGPNAVPERARTSIEGRGRTKDPIRDYVWGPDAMVILAGRAS